MKRLIAGMFLCGVLTGGAQAAPAVFQGSVLTIEEAIVLQGGKAVYYRDLQLQVSGDRNFQVVGAQATPLATVEEVSLVELHTEPAQIELVIAGYKSTPCVELKTAVVRHESSFHVVVAEIPLQTLVACIQVIEPFQLVLPVDVTGLPPGEYTVNVHGQELDFSL